MDKYDVIIVGGSCAGLSAAIYTGRRALKTLVISSDLGGQVALTNAVENYSGAGTISTETLINNFRSQAEKAGVEIKIGEVQKIEKLGEEFIVGGTLGDFSAKSVILALGLTHRKLGVTGEAELHGRGVAYCATCDGPLFRAKTVAVVGGGNSAVEAADYLSNICEKVYVIVRKESFRADEVALVEKIKNQPNIEILFNTAILELKGEKRLEKAILNNGTELEIAGVFVEIGYQAKTDFLQGFIDLDEQGQIIVDNLNKTNVPGIFSAGDVTNLPFKQMIIASGEGAKAALSVARFIQKTNVVRDY